MKLLGKIRTLRKQNRLPQCELINLLWNSAQDKVIRSVRDQIFREFIHNQLFIQFESKKRVYQCLFWHGTDMYFY